MSKIKKTVITRITILFLMTTCIFQATCPLWGFFSKDSCSNQIIGSKKFATKTVDFNGPIDSLSISSIITCTLQQGPKPQLEIKANENILEKINITYKNKKLALELDSDNYKNINISCTLTTPYLPQEITASGNSQITVDHNEQPTDLNINLSGNSNATILQGIFKQLTVQLSGNSKTYIQKGSFALLHANVRSNSSIMAPDITTQQATLSSSGNSLIKIGTVSKCINASASGNSSIYFTALADTQISKKTSGMGTIAKK